AGGGSGRPRRGPSRTRPLPPPGGVQWTGAARPVWIAAWRPTGVPTMADRAGRAAATRRVRALPPRQLAVPWIAVAALAGVAWVVTILLARSMGNGPGTMGLALPPFLGLWAVMMSAMMLPSVAPVAVLWTRLISGAS